jgi:hypothetical protein
MAKNEKGKRQTNKVMSYMVMTGLDLSDEAYTASVTAINAMYVRSNKVSSNITIQPSSPNISNFILTFNFERGSSINFDYHV